MTGLFGDLAAEDEELEECDDGNDLVGDGCSAACLAEICGNGRLDEGGPVTTVARWTPARHEPLR